MLSEAASKDLLARFGIPFAREEIASTPEAAVTAAREIGYPVVLKLNGDGIAHKTERGLVRLNVADADTVRKDARDLLSSATEDDGEVTLLVAPMLFATRELIVGLDRDDQFGMTVLLGVGGILAEAIADVTMRLVPIDRSEAEEMIDDLATAALLGEFRGEPSVNRSALADILLALSSAATTHPEIVSVDVNPLLIVEGSPIAVDALVEIER
jgi:acetate---CoA ligase (ADP-forming) subunit beta